MGRKTTVVLIVMLLLPALAVPLGLRLRHGSGQTRTIPLEAHRYGYQPERIIVNQGDTIIFKPTSRDVTHGFLLDGYGLEFIIKQEHVAYLKYTWQDDDGKTQSDWEKVNSIELQADKAGKFTFRCTQTCGSLHPFMVGELIVSDNTP